MGETLVFFGNERLATGVTTTAPTLHALIKAGYKIAAVVSSFVPGQSRSARSLEIATVAEAYRIPLLLPQKPGEVKDQLRAYGAAAGILVAYGRIVPQEIIDLFPQGIINIHPSLLPLHRGPTPIESVMLDGSTETGTSLMSLVKEMDAGPVYAQSPIALSGKETKQTLAETLLDIGSTMLIDLLPGILKGEIVAIPQDDGRATYDERISKDDGLIDWSKPAVRLEREIRAFAEWPKSRTTLGGKDIIVTKAYAAPSRNPESQPGSIKTEKESNLIMVTTGSGMLCIERLKPAGKTEMTAREFLAGYPL